MPPINPPSPNPELSFTADIKPLFRDSDRDAMRAYFDLWSLPDVRTYGSAIVERLRDGSMPCDGPWPPQQIDLFERWLADGDAE
jgi:hypothetical protein